jgi:hypothetical protein
VDCQTEASDDIPRWYCFRLSYIILLFITRFCLIVLLFCVLFIVLWYIYI